MRSFALVVSLLWAGVAAAEVDAQSHLSLESGEGVPPPRGLRKGKVHLELWASDINYANLGVKLGGGSFYLTFISGFDSEDRVSRFNLALGVGGHINLSPRFWLDLDVTGGGVQPVQKPFESDGGNVLGQARVMLGIQLFPRLALLLGPTYNLWYTWGEQDFESITRLSYSESRREDDRRLQHWLGLQVGVHI